MTYGMVPILNAVTAGFFDAEYNSPVISCIGEGTTEWQRFGYPNMFIRVPRVTVPNFQKFPCKENVLQRF